jgi:hypothetical protein
VHAAVEGKVAETYGGEAQGVNLDTEGGHVLLLKLTSQVALDEGGLEVALSVLLLLVLPLLLLLPLLPVLVRLSGGARSAARCSEVQLRSSGGDEWEVLTLPVPPSPTRTSLNLWESGTAAEDMMGVCDGM